MKVFFRISSAGQTTYTFKAGSESSMKIATKNSLKGRTRYGRWGDMIGVKLVSGGVGLGQ